MLIDARINGTTEGTAARAAACEQDGYDGAWVSERGHEPFLQVLRASDATDRITVGTAVAVAFGRTPLTVAHAAYDLAGYSRGRFVLGLGSEVKPHIERRFSMPWSRPAARMREFVLALRAIWSCWHDGRPLSFHGEFYTHDLMTPAFSPDRHEFGPPPVLLAGVGPLMTEVAADVCDGFFLHPFTTRAYFDAVTRPALLRGCPTGLDGFTMAGPTLVAVGRDEPELASAVRRTKAQIAYYASTPSYRPVLDLHGYGELQPELTRLARLGRWAEMAGLVDDGLLHEVAVVGEPDVVTKGVVARWGDVHDRISLYASDAVDRTVMLEIVDGIRRSMP